MPQRDIYHNNVRNALIKDGWTITHDPFEIRMGKLRGYADLGAERALAAEKGNQKIVVEIKSFVGASLMADLEDAIGQFVLYRTLMAKLDAERLVYLAIGEDVFRRLFDDPTGQVLIEDIEIRLVVVHFDDEEIVRWIE